MTGTLGLSSYVEGFREAHRRFETARLGTDAHDAFRAIFETLTWTTAIDTLLKETTGEWVEIPELRGMRYARHSVFHLWADALYRTDTGFSSPVTSPMTSFEWRWRLDLPRPQQDKDKPAYVEHLAGKPVRHALASVARHLSDVAT